MSFSYRGETKELNELTRTEACGSFIRLSDGFTHYELSNPEAGQTVVLVHGFSTPYFIYDPTFEFLTRAGLSVLRYDLFGRGFSDRPQVHYTADLFVRQLESLLDGLQVTGPVSLVGLSMGGPITAAFTVHSPARVNRLVWIDPAGTKAAAPSRALKVAALPGIGETLLNLIGSGGLVTQIASDIFDKTYVEHFQSRYRVQMQYRGFKQAILSTVRSGMLGSFLNEYRCIGKMGKPVLLFWGRQDHTIPCSHSDILRAAIPGLEFHIIEQCGHIPHYEKPGEVNPILLRFLRS
jgi:pimeloyl-ACP methyl ester carboxylesterase